MSVKTSLHAQGYEPWLNDYLAESGTTWMKFVNAFPVLPGVSIIGRVHIPESEQDVMIAKGAAGADQFYARVFPEMDKARHVTIWEGPNEPSIWNQSVLNGFHAFYQRLIGLYHAGGFDIMAGQFNTGWPFLPKDDGGAQSAICGRAIQGADGVSFHEYDSADLRANPGYNMLRYRKTADYWRSLGLTVPSVFITEHGLDRMPGTASFGHDGWKTILGGNLEEYIDQLCWYESEIQKDDCVVAATVFSVVTNWADFALDHGQSLELAKALANSEPPPPPPPPERARGFMATKYQTTLNWPLIAQDYDYVWLRVSGPNTPNGYTFTEVDPWLARHVAGAESVGLLKGGFHYLVPELTGQAAIFAKAAAPYTWELPLICDVEQGGLTRERVDGFLAAADKRLAENNVQFPELGIYTNLYLWGKLGPWDRLLWLAQWGVSEPSISEWKFWQHDGGDIPDGEKTSLDVFNGTSEELYETYGNGGEEPYMDVKVFGYIEGEDGPQEEKSWDWLMQEFGPLEVQLAEPFKQDDGSMQVVRLVEIREQYGPANCNIELFHIDGSPVEGIGIAWYYSTAPLLQATTPPTSRWEDRADVGKTNSEGVVGFSLSEDSYYQPDLGEIGPYAAWVLGLTHPSDFIRGIGMDWATNHRHVNLKFQVVITDDGPEPVDPEDGELVEQLARIADALEELVAWVKR